LMPCDPRHRVIPLPAREAVEDPEEAAGSFRDAMATRRSVRTFSRRPVSEEVIRLAIETAGSAPSGANIQPWRFVVVTDPALKAAIRDRAEEEERTFYAANHEEWHAALAPLGTDADKPHLTGAPALIVVFEVHAGEGEPKPYYVKESVGIAVGFLLASLHLAGLATLTHTPSPMGFLNEILDRPPNERPYVVIPVGYPADDATVPVLQRKSLDEISVWRS
jgi:iodotyrosine deiodinase